MALDEVLAAVPELHEVQSVEPLPGGLTNTNYKVTSPSGRFVVRISHKDSELLAIDRANETHNTIAAAEAGVGARFVAAVPDCDALVLEFLDAETMSPEQLRRGDRLRDAAAAIRRLHAARRFLHDFDMFELQARYLKIVRERGFRLPERYEALEPQARRIEEALRADPEATVPCNNDLLAENFLWTGDEFRLIDYEYSGNNEASFELGNAWAESGLSLEQLEELVSAYWGRSRPSKVARARLWGAISRYGWTLWASIQDGVSELEFDFWSWGMEKYERAREELEGPQFEQLLVDVQRDDQAGRRH